MSALRWSSGDAAGIISAIRARSSVTLCQLQLGCFFAIQPNLQAINGHHTDGAGFTFVTLESVRPDGSGNVSTFGG